MRNGSARRGEPLNRFVVITGCSGGGKSTLLAELGRRGFATVPEPGRRIVRQELARGGKALPWLNPPVFAWRAVGVARADRRAAMAEHGWVFFDRGIVDAAAALAHATAAPLGIALAELGAYHPTVFFAPPWPEIYVTDPERPHGYDEAVAEYGRLERAYAAFGYVALSLPKVSVAERADFVLNRIGSAPVA